jgi:hypothetical protein
MKQSRIMLLMAVIRERRGIPYHLVDAQPDEPAEQKAVLDPLFTDIERIATAQSRQ